MYGSIGSKVIGLEFRAVAEYMLEVSLPRCFINLKYHVANKAAINVGDENKILSNVLEKYRISRHT